jgi:hypothetical protein
VFRESSNAGACETRAAPGAGPQAVPRGFGASSPTAGWVCHSRIEIRLATEG